MKFSAVRFILCAAVAITVSLNAAAQVNAGPTKAGKIKAVAITGEVFKQAADGTKVKLANGSKDSELKETDTVITSKNSSVILVFANASTVKLGGETQLAIEEFKVDDPDATLDMASYKNRATDTEPGVSTTSLKLAYGEMVGDVKHLNRDRGSSYNIQTPVGAAGIRGTIYRIVYTPSSDGKAFFQVVTTEGLVVLKGLIDAEVPIAAGKQVEVTIDIPATPPAAGTPATTTPVTVVGATEENKKVIESATALITAVIPTITFAPTTPTPTDTTKKDDTPPTPPPAPVPPTVTLTPGAGG